MDGNLVFRGPPDGTGNLVFGDADGGGGIAPVSVIIDAELPGLGTAGITLAVATRVVLDASLPGLDGEVGLVWDANVSRGLRHEVQSHWQDGTQLHAAATAHWQETEQLQSAAIVRWQEAAELRQASRQHWQETERLRAVLQSRYQAAVSLRAATRQHWEETERLRGVLQARYQLGISLRAATRQHWQENERLRSALLEHWQEGMGLHNGVRSFWQEGDGVRIAMRQHWQEAMCPAAGVSPRPKPPVKVPCYDVATAANLLFEEAWANDGHLVFICYRPGPEIPGAAIVVPSRRTYIMINSIEIRRADDLAGDPLPSEAFAMNLDHQSWTWSFSATFHPSVAGAVTPGPDGEPVELEVRVNGQPFRLQAERWGKSMRFPEQLIKVSGRGKACVLDAPHSPEQTFGNTQARSAHQLMLDVLTINGVGMGWAVDFKLTDWSVPGNQWSHQGTYITALAEIASAAGGYLQPHDTDPTIRVLPLWPKPWWEWDNLTPDISLPDGMGEVEDSDWSDHPLYNRIFLEGGAGGITADFRREGTNGGILKPMVVHPLITGMEVARQRAIAELSQSGRMVDKALTMPILPETGVIRPGAVLDFRDEHQVHRIGIVRSTAINWTFPVLTQTLKVQCHA
ncbi:hypothetical protein ABE501_05345 [Comamonas testosteroni]